MAAASAVAWGGLGVHADGRGNRGKTREDDDQSVKTVFVVAMENHNWTQPETITNPSRYS